MQPALYKALIFYAVLHDTATTIEPCASVINPPRSCCRRCSAFSAFLESVFGISKSLESIVCETLRTMADTRVGWVPEPTGRGMVGLIYNCLFTIFLCTWTANRRKVPKANAGISLMHAFYFSSNAIVAETTDGHRQLASFSLAQNLIIHCYPSLFTISKEEIEDKSKADTVARAIILLLFGSQRKLSVEWLNISPSAHWRSSLSASLLTL